MMGIGVHQSHCCALHGCKYGDDMEGGDGCPVVDGAVVQDHLCEDCGWDGGFGPDICSLEELAFRVRIEKAGNELKIKALHIGLGALHEPLPTEEQLLMRKYLECLVRDLNRAEGVDY